MGDFSSSTDLQALSALLSPEPEQRSGEDSPNPMAKMGPGNIGPPPSVSVKEKEAVHSAYQKKNTKDIWDVEEVSEGTHLDDLADPRPQPEYEVILKQSVGTEDLFLGLSRKDPSSMSCESILVRVKLPDTKASELVLDVRETFLDLRTPKFKLGLHLPHPVHRGEGRARFLTESAELEVTLPMNRPLDCINRA